MLQFCFIEIIILTLCFGCASIPKYHGQFSGTLQPVILQDVAGEKFTGVILKIDSAKFDSVKHPFVEFGSAKSVSAKSSFPPLQAVIGDCEILVNSSWYCYRPTDFKTNQITVVGWMQTGAIKSPLSNKEIPALQNTNQYFYGALVIKRRNIYYGRMDQ